MAGKHLTNVGGRGPERPVTPRTTKQVKVRVGGEWSSPRAETVNITNRKSGKQMTGCPICRLRLRIAEIDKEISGAKQWGAKLGALAEERRGIERRLAAEERR